jgi:peptidoglycan/LPS O-acetylase OafA/YrhL
MNPSVPERLHGLDALRGFALLLGIALHATMSYLPGAKYIWIVADSDPSTLLGIGFFTIHVFRMTVFFVLTGFFARLALDRLGLKAFAKDRWRRIALPLLSFWPIVFPMIVAAIVWAAWFSHGGELPKESPPGPSFMPDDFPLAHLWFLYVLLLFYVAAIVLRAMLNRLGRNGHIHAVIDRITRFALGPVAPFLLALPVAIALFARDVWMPWFGVPTPDHSLYPNASSLVAYGVAFAVGWQLRSATDFLDGWQRRWPLNLAIAIIATAACLAVAGLQPSAAISTHSARDLLYAALYGIAGWSWTLALIGLALRFASGFSPVRRYLADASYWMYLMHLPLVMALQVAFSRVDWPWAVEYPLLLVACISILLLSYHFGVRNSSIGAMLNGRRARDRITAATQDSSHTALHVEPIASKSDVTNSTRMPDR